MPFRRCQPVRGEGGVCQACQRTPRTRPEMAGKDRISLSTAQDHLEISFFQQACASLSQIQDTIRGARYGHMPLLAVQYGQWSSVYQEREGLREFRSSIPASFGLSSPNMLSHLAERFRNIALSEPFSRCLNRIVLHCRIGSHNLPFIIGLIVCNATAKRMCALCH